MSIVDAKMLAALDLDEGASEDQVLAALKSLTTRANKARKALHSSATPEWGTNPAVVEAGRYVMGGIDLDPCSNGYWNHHLVKATRFYDKEQDGLKQPWYGRVHLNPPGDPSGRDVRAFWERLIKHYTSGEVECAWWVGFNLGQLSQLQNAPMHPLQLLTVIPCERIGYAKRAGSGPPEIEPQPTHASYITLLHSRRSPAVGAAMVARFREVASALHSGIKGAIVRPL